MSVGRFVQGVLDILPINAMAFSYRIYYNFPIHDISLTVLLIKRLRTLRLHRRRRHHLVL